MKRLIIITAMFMAWVSTMKADEIVVPNIVIPKGGTAILDIQLNNEQELNRTFGFFINLPEGITVVDETEKRGERFNGTNVSVVGTPESDGRYKIMAFNGISSDDDYPIPGNSGTIVTVELEADESIDEGTVLNASIENIELNLFSKETDGAPSDVPTTTDFLIIIGQPDDGRIKFYETSTTLPTYTAGETANVTMYRAIKANQWSTICLPFAMSEAQVKTAFGADVELGDFTGYEDTKDADENVESIRVKFDAVTAIEANHPYIIKVSSDISEFTVDGVDINPTDKPMVSFGYNTGKKPIVYHPMDFVGTYVADFDFYNAATSYPLFLSGNKFYYATENTKHMKAFRAYFDFDDYLPEAESSSSRIVMSFDDSETNGIQSLNAVTGNHFYDLQGRRVEKPSKGMYVNKGKIIVVK